MDHSRTWIIPVFFGILVVLAVLPKIIDLLRRRKFMAGTGDKLFGARMFRTSSDEETVKEALAERNGAELLVFSSEYNKDDLMMTFFKIRAKKLQRSIPVTYSVKFIPSGEGYTDFEVTVQNSGKFVSSRYEPYINEFFSVKVNAYRIFTDENGNVVSSDAERSKKERY